jgi:soluble lytic murein transglycosylase
MQKLLSSLVLILTLVFHCRSSGSADLARYAGTGANSENGYLTFYAQGQKLSARTQATGKLRAYLLSAMREPDLKLSCSAWDCVASVLSAIRGSDRSPLYGYAVYHLAAFAEQQNYPREALAILAHASDTPQPLARRISLLRGRLLLLNGAPAATRAEHWQKHADTYSDAESLYLAAHGLDMAGDKRGATQLAWRALEKPEADFPFAQSGLLLRNVLGQAIYTQPSVAQRIRLMEALRVAKDRASAAKLWQSLRGEKLSGRDQLLFTQYAARLLADKGNFADLARTVAAAGLEFLAAENEKPALDICERLLKKKQFPMVRNLFPPEPATKPAYQCLLRLAQRSSDYSPSARALAARYITEFDAESTLAERIFLRSCLPGVGTHHESWDIACLEQLRSITRQKNLGGGARYFLARHYDGAGETDKVRELLTELAQDYSDDYYFYRLMERPLSAQKAWAQSHRSDGTRLGYLLEVLLTGDVARARGLPETSQLKAFENDIAQLSGRLDGDRRLALLLLAADSRDEMRELLRSEEKPEIYKVLAALGVVAQKPDMALYGAKMLIRDSKLKPFLFEIPDSLRTMLYPQAYGAYVEKYAARNELEKAEVFALIRQESQFFAGAISPANAQGLMQVLPSTAELLAAKEGLSDYDLLNAEHNIRLGTVFMRDIRKAYAADFTGLAIAYNAGPGRLQQWRRKYSHDDDIFVEEIPFQETYHYVRVLLADRARYRALLAEK